MSYDPKTWVYKEIIEDTDLNHIEQGIKDTEINLQSQITEIQETAEDAQETANKAQNAANTAQTTADSAQTTASAAQNTADSAQIIANNALSAAQNAVYEAESYTDSKISNLDYDDTIVSGQYVAGVNETDGIISVIRATLPTDSNEYDEKGAAQQALEEAKAYTDTIGELTSIMMYCGTIGTGGTYTSVPTTNIHIGDTYQIITNGTWAGFSCNNGDLLIAKNSGNVAANSNNWIHVATGSGEDNDTVTSLRYNSSNSNLTTVAQTGDLIVGEAAIKQIDSSISASTSSTNLPTSNAVANYVTSNVNTLNNTISSVQSTANTALSTAQNAVSEAESYTDSKINSLDYNDNAVNGQYVSAVTETNGIISVIRATLPTDSNEYDEKGAAQQALEEAKAYTDTIGESTSIMVYCGTIGTGGTFTSVPTSNVHIGDTYQIITNGTWAGFSCNNGDLLIAKNSGNVAANSNNWIHVATGSGEDNDTVTSLRYNSSNSNLTTVAQTGDLIVGEAAIKQIDTSLSSSTSTTNLPTSNAVVNYVNSNVTTLNNTISNIQSTANSAQSTANSAQSTASTALSTAQNAVYEAESYTDSKINSLDYNDNAVNGQYVSAVTETNGIISVVRATLPTDSNEYDEKGAAQQALEEAKAYTDTIGELTSIMMYCGTIGTGGTYTSVPTSNVHIGDTYQIISGGILAGYTCTEGDLLIAKASGNIAANANNWVHVDTGGTDTITSLKYSSSSTNLTTSAQTGDLTVGEAAIKQVDTYLSSSTSSTNLPTSSAVINYVDSSVNNLNNTISSVQSTANSAQSAADTAQNTANNAQSTAESAQNTANSALSTAQNAVYEAESYTDSKINGLNYNDSISNGQYVSAVSETNGIISVNKTSLPTVSDNATSNYYVSSVSENLGQISVTRTSLPDYSNTYDTKGAADTALSEAMAYADSLAKATDAMVFRGTLGSGGTVTSVPTSDVVIGDTYKVITAGTWAGYSCTVGDLLIAQNSGSISANSNNWAYVPSGDEEVTTLRTGTSNLTSAAQTGDLIVGEAATKSVDNTIATKSTSQNLPTSEAVADYVASLGLTSSSGTITSVTSESPISGSATEGDVVISHEKSGVTAGNYGSNYSTMGNSSFGTTLNPVIGYISVDNTGHITKITETSIILPDAEATSTRNGLMTAADKVKLDSIDLDNITLEWESL